MKILFGTGGSGGHIFPALQTALELKKRGHDVLFAGALGMAEQKLAAEGFTVINIDALGFNSSPAGMFRFTFSMFKSFSQAVRIIRRFDPDKIVGFGGYSSFPLLAAARVEQRPVMIHEQNVVPGKANRLLAKMADKVAVSFHDSIKYFNPAKVVWTGCPCNNQLPQRSRNEIRASFGFKPADRVIALLGGSQGSKRLNEVFFEAMQGLALQSNVQGIHMTGKKDHGHYAAKYKEASLPVTAHAFISPIEEMYAAVDVVVGRAGAATVSELGSFAIPSVLVPYPFADGHQRYNALVLSNAGAAILLEQKELTAKALANAIGTVSTNDFSRARVAEKIDGLFVKDAAIRLADAVEAL